MTGKEKCSFLRQIRTRIAAENHIEWVEEECTYSGPCKGTCPACDAKVQKLQNAVNALHTGKKIVAAAALVSCLSTAGGCSIIQEYFDDSEPDEEVLTGEVDGTAIEEPFEDSEPEE